jgi:hypothetical protein
VGGERERERQIKREREAVGWEGLERESERSTPLAFGAASQR